MLYNVKLSHVKTIILTAQHCKASVRFKTNCVTPHNCLVWLKYILNLYLFCSAKFSMFHNFTVKLVILKQVLHNLLFFSHFCGILSGISLALYLINRLSHSLCTRRCSTNIGLMDRSPLTSDQFSTRKSFMLTYNMSL